MNVSFNHLVELVANLKFYTRYLTYLFRQNCYWSR